MQNCPKSVLRPEWFLLYCCHVLPYSIGSLPKKPSLTRILNQKLKHLVPSFPNLRRGRSTKVKVLAPGKAGPMNPEYASSSSSSKSDTSHVSNSSMTNHADEDVLGVSGLHARSNDLGKLYF